MYAFTECEKLANVTLSNSITQLSKYVFSYCFALRSITIPDSVTSIGDHAFYLCKNLVSMTLSKSVTSINSSAFYACNNLRSVTYCGTAREWSSISSKFNSSTVVTYHKWDDGEITLEPTLGQDGSKIYSCQICKETKTETIPQIKPPETTATTTAAKSTATATVTTVTATATVTTVTATAADTAKSANDGCGAALSTSVLMMIPTALAAAFVTRRKED